MWDGISILHPPNQILALLFILLYLIWIELRRAREARGWTAEEAADQVGVDARTYSGWERGEHEPRALNRLTLARTFPELNKDHKDGALTWGALMRGHKGVTGTVGAIIRETYGEKGWEQLGIEKHRIAYHRERLMREILKETPR